MFVSLSVVGICEKITFRVSDGNKNLPKTYIPAYMTVVTVVSVVRVVTVVKVVKVMTVVISWEMYTWAIQCHK